MIRFVLQRSRVIDLKDKTVLVTGGSGFLGQHLIPALVGAGAEVIAPGRDRLQLLCENEIYPFLLFHHPDMVVHLAATVGGIGANQKEPGRFFYENLKMGVNLIHACKDYNQSSHLLQKLLVVGTTCSYPKVPPRIPFKEEDLWAGYPEETNAPYGIAKKALITMLMAYRDQYELPGVCAILANLYGPGDHDDPANSHVIPALIRKILQAQKDDGNVLIWGTGRATREFLYVEDAVDGLVRLLRAEDPPLVMNLGGGEEISIKALVTLLADLIDFRGEIAYDPSKPDGQPRRTLDSCRAWAELGWAPEVPLMVGLQRTIDSMIPKATATGR